MIPLPNRMNFWKSAKGGGVVKGRFEFFQKFIRFGGLTCPIVKKFSEIENVDIVESFPETNDTSKFFFH